MKKIISLILTLTLLLSTATYAFATNEDGETNENDVNLEEASNTKEEQTSSNEPIPEPKQVTAPTNTQSNEGDETLEAKATAVAEFQYTRDGEIINEKVTVTEYAPASPTAEKNIKEYEIKTTETTNIPSEKKETEDVTSTEITTTETTTETITVNDNKETITQKNKEETIVTLAGEPVASEDAKETKVEIKTASGVIVNIEGGNPTYSFENSILTISGEGVIPDYKTTITEADSTKTDIPLTDATPWASFASQVIELIIESGITKIGDFAFANMNNLQQVDIYSKTITIGDYAFANDESLDNVNFLDKNADPTFEHETTTVTYKDENGNKTEETGSTAFANDEVSINYSCINPNKTDLKTESEFALAKETYTDLHLNCNVIPGYAPTETEYGRTDGVYCLDCKQTIIAQQIIYPNGKAETGKYNIVDFSKLKEVPKSLEGTKYDTLEKVAELQNEITNALAVEFKAEFKTELNTSNVAIYNIELTNPSESQTEDTYVVNIPYPAGTSQTTTDFVAVQLTEDDEIESVDTFLTNKGIQIEVETLKPVGVAWSNK